MFERLKRLYEAGSLSAAGVARAVQKGWISEVQQALITGDVSGLTVAQLKEYAEAKNIDVSGLTLKADILAAVNAAEG